MTETEVQIPVDGAVIRGTLTVPEGGLAPGIPLLGGTFSDLRDGDPDPEFWHDIPAHGMYRVLSDALAEAGFAVLRFDRRGCGSSSGSRPDRATEIADAGAAWEWLRGHDAVAGAWAMVGESAGAYVLCRLASEGARPSAVVLQGALHRSIAGLIEFNASRARAFWERGEAERDWMWAEARREYESAVTGKALLAAIRDGTRSIRVEDSRTVFERTVDSLNYDIEYPPAEQFRFLNRPSLVLHGADDLNVPVEDAFQTTRTLWESGNRDVELTVISRADHSMQSTPDDLDIRLRERMSFESFRRPYHARYPAVVAEFFLRQRGANAQAAD
jgi:pimeloyl-ACP methyl ester carboxylesterase